MSNGKFHSMGELAMACEAIGTALTRIKLGLPGGIVPKS